jgi:pyruvate/2-oxoglutarate dehydrogenase complex dihydrolipoamide dehydrogenase (E3) component/uncharacterized membrane protein YdjX (TVP38/TMEM64 family)
MKRIGFVLALALLVVAFFALGLDQTLSLDGARQGFASAAAWRDTNPVLFALGFFAAYVLIAAASLPGAVVLTLMAGALFSYPLAVVLVSFASSLGATLAFISSRYLLGQWVQTRWGDRLQAINHGVEREGAFYLFGLRLVPLFPFFLINLAMGLLPMRARTFYWVSQLGMLPATLIYVNAGTQLAALDQLSGIASTPVLVSLAALGVFPLIARRVIERVRRRRYLARFARPSRFDRNLVVIGAGAAGLVSAYVAATLRAKVTLVHASPMGGDCLNTGCVPSKTLIASARQAQRMRDAARFGISAVDPQIDFGAVMARVRDAIAEIAPNDSPERYRSLGVEVVDGRASIVDPWTVRIDTADGSSRHLSTRAIVLATGAEPVLPTIAGLRETDYVTSDTLWARLNQLSRPPARVLVLGGGAIGCELGQALARLGSSVTLIEQGAQLLPALDAEASALVREQLESEGVHVLTGSQAVAAEPGMLSVRVMNVPERTPGTPSAMPGATLGLAVRADADTGTGVLRLPFDLLLIALGRKPRLSGLGLETLGLLPPMSEGGVHRFAVPNKTPLVSPTIEFDAYLQSLCPTIYVAGDVAGPWRLTHAASHQAWHAAVNALADGLWRFKADDRLIPRVIYTEPEVACLGLDETQARARGVRYEVTRLELSTLDRTIVDGTAQGFVKVLTVPGRDRILGVTIAGAHAGELLAEFALAMRYRLGLGRILATLHAYPGYAEAAQRVAGQWRKAHSPIWALALAERWHRWRLKGG